MKIVVESGRIEDKATEFLTLSLFQGEALEGFAKDIDDALGGAITELTKGGDFSGKLNQQLMIYPQGKIQARRLLLIGLGKKDEFNLEGVRVASGRAALQARELGLASYTTVLHGEGHGRPLEDLTQALVEGSELALYNFSRYRTDKEKTPKEVAEMTVYIRDGGSIDVAQRSVALAEAVCDATKLARDLANAPSSDMTPSSLAEVAREVARRYSLKCTIFEREDIERLGMGGLYGVSKGSQQPPKLIILEYHGGGEDKGPVVLVGKAVTFDSGGISIKPSEKMEEMKFDKSGGAAVIATMQAVAELKLPLNVVGIVPATENMPSGSAYKPGDILRFYNGKTAEIVNTDAEGRLILADALAYATNYKPEAIIDLATLTGACVVALGTNASGLFTNDRQLARKLTEAGELSGERVWELPLWKEYHEQIKSDYADMKNSGGRPAGAITAAALLSNFVGDSPWAHLDIAGTAWTQEGGVEKAYLPKGATGFGVRLLVRLLMGWPS